MTFDENTVAQIAALNDAFRENPFMQERGSFFITCGVESIPDAKRIEAIKQLVTFSEFTEDNDPYGWHDFGCIEIHGIDKIFWKIDIFEDKTMTYGAEEPHNPDKSYRVLTLMLASEY